MAIRTGLNTRIAFGEESAYGTEVARTVTQRLISTTLQRKVTLEPLPDLVSISGTGRVRGVKFQSMERVSGEQRAVACYEGNALGILLKHALGSVATTGVGPYVHTHTVGDALPTGLSSELQRGMDGSAASTAEEFLGGRVSKLSLECDPGKAMEVIYTLLCKTGNARASQSLPALSATQYPVLHHHAGTVSWNGNTYTLAKFGLSIDNKLPEIHELGSQFITEPPIVDFADVMLEAEIISRNDNAYTGQLVGTQGDLTITFDDTANTKTMAFTLHNAVIEESTEAISGPGEIRLKVRWRGYAATSESGLSIAITNGNSSAIAA